MFFSFSFFLADQTVFQIYQLKKTQKTKFDLKTFKLIFRILIEIITMLYFRSVDFALKLISNNRKTKIKKNEFNQ